jgi:hypothetical protein
MAVEAGKHAAPLARVIETQQLPHNAGPGEGRVEAAMSFPTIPVRPVINLSTAGGCREEGRETGTITWTHVANREYRAAAFPHCGEGGCGRSAVLLPPP